MTRLGIKLVLILSCMEGILPSDSGSIPSGDSLQRGALPAGTVEVRIFGLLSLEEGRRQYFSS